ncbi:hypothetical protein [Virgibacillus ndiopensis]|uniref:hypothetical protein n=1 Tax=Virgibacillus ndiopensis TaxID=2004408 RepID=UPI000C079FFD|nr:hypothetical protein [Virgibacillus ndiopensis]
MKSRYNNDKQVINLLKDMPKVKDSRDKNEIFQRISTQMKNEKTSIKQKKTYLIPILSSALVVAIMLVIIPVVLNNEMFQRHEEKLSLNKAADSSSSSGESGIKMNEQEDAALSNDKSNPELSLFSKSSENLVLTEIDAQSDIVHAAVSDQQGQYMIPVTFVIPKTEELESYYNKVETYLKAEEWGVSGYLFKDATFKFDYTNNHVIMNLPKGFSLNHGSANATIFEDTLSAMFRHLGFKKVVFETDNNQAVDLGQIGNISELPIKPAQKSSYKLYQASDDKRKFLIPIPLKEQTEIEAALNGMKQNEETFSIFQTIPNKIGFNVDESSGDQLSITFAEDNSLKETSITLQEKNTMIEAILMTAKSYGYNSVKFNNTGIDQIGIYNLTEAIKVPLAVNPIKNEEK